MSKIRVVRIGESLPFTFDRGGESIEGWICTLNVLQFPGDTPKISRVIPSNVCDKNWPGFLTSTETNELIEEINHNLWMAIGVLTKSSTDEEEQIAQGTVRFSLTEEWA